MDNPPGNASCFEYMLISTNSTSPISDPCPVDTSADGCVNQVRGTISDEEIILASSHPKKRAGRKKFKETRHPVYRGVRKRNLNKWVCEVREPIKQKRIWLGTYPTADMAARAHDVAALALKGQTATLNFADSVWRLPVPSSNDPKDIRKAAIEGAEQFRPRESSDTSPVRVEIEENVFDIKGWVMSMAQGPLFSPTLKIGCGFSWDDVEDDVEVSLWNY